MTTKAEMAQRVGEDLGLVPIGQALENHDLARINATFDETYERLKEKGLATWAFTAEVPEKLAPFYALLMEEKLVTSYGVSEARYTRIVNSAGPDGMIAMARLAELAIPEQDDIDGETDF